MTLEKKIRPLPVRTWTCKLQITSLALCTTELSPFPTDEIINNDDQDLTHACIDEIVNYSVIACLDQFDDRMAADDEIINNNDDQDLTHACIDEIVDNNDVIACLDQFNDRMAADVASTPCHENGLPRRHPALCWGLQASWEMEIIVRIIHIVL